LHLAQLMPLPLTLSLASVKSRLVLPCWYRLTWVVPEKGPLNRCVLLLGRSSTESRSSSLSTSGIDTDVSPHHLLLPVDYLHGRGHRFTTVILSNLNRFRNIFTGRFLGKSALKWILKIPPHRAYVAHAKCGGIFNIHLTANLPRNLPVIFLNRLRFDRIMVMSLWPRFFRPPCR